jgi:hypothetical protein
MLTWLDGEQDPTFPFLKICRPLVQMTFLSLEQTTADWRHDDELRHSDVGMTYSVRVSLFVTDTDLRK